MRASIYPLTATFTPQPPLTRPLCHGALPDGRSEAMGCVSVYHHCLLAETIYEVGYCAKKSPPAKTARDSGGASPIDIHYHAGDRWSVRWIEALRNGVKLDPAGARVLHLCELNES